LADDLAALEALAGTSTIYYRSGTSAWSAVTIGAGVTFTAGALDRAALTGDVTASAGSNATTVANNAVTYAKMQDVTAASRLIGRGSAAGAGDPQEIALGTNLTMAGTTLNATSGGLTVAIQKFTSSGTYTPMAGMTYAIVELVGGGGGGGAAYAESSSVFRVGGGGGAGGYSRKLVTAADIGASKTVTIGAGGLGGIGNVSATPADGSAGGDTSVGVLCMAKGGQGGFATPSSVAPAGGVGGSGAAGTGDVTGSGASGGGGYNGTSAGVPAVGHGGSSYFGGGATLSSLSYDSSTGVDATNYGSGGSGGTAYNVSGRSGGNGSAGFVIITEYK
jgi:hypothetical protein